MRIERLDVVPYALPFKEPYVTARGRLERRELALVRVRAGNSEGLGEAAPLALRGGATLAQIVSELERCGSLIAGASPAEVSAPPGLSPQARLGIELALLDLNAKLDGVEAFELLDDPKPGPVRCNATLSTGPPEQVAERAAEWAALGFETFKLKAGVPGDVDQVTAVRAALGAAAKLRIDANASWTVGEAQERLEAMGPLELAEQPVATVREMAELRACTDVPLSADEIVTNPAEARAAASACDVATVKLAKVGGIATAFAIARELPVYLSSALDGPVGIAAAAHVAQALPDAGFAHGLATSLLFGDTIAARECTVAGGHLHLTGGPGLGVEIDEAALERCRM